MWYRSRPPLEQQSVLVLGTLLLHALDVELSSEEIAWPAFEADA